MIFSCGFYHLVQGPSYEEPHPLSCENHYKHEELLQSSETNENHPYGKYQDVSKRLSN